MLHMLILMYRNKTNIHNITKLTVTHIIHMHQQIHK